VRTPWARTGDRPVAPTPAALRQAVFSVLRIGLGLGLAAFMLHLTLRSAGSNLGRCLGAANPLLLALAGLLFGGVICLGAWRWGILLRIQGVRLPYADLWRLTMIGQFFSLAIPGAVGGDLVKMGYIARRVPAGKTAESILTIVLDRIVGILGLFALASVLVLLNLRLLLALPPARLALYRHLVRGNYRAMLRFVFTSSLALAGMRAKGPSSRALKASFWLKRLKPSEASQPGVKSPATVVSMYS